MKNNMIKLTILSLMMINIVSGLNLIKKKGDFFNHPDKSSDVKTSLAINKNVEVANTCGMILTSMKPAQIISNTFSYFPIDSYTSKNADEVAIFNNLIIDMFEIATVQQTSPSVLSKLIMKVSPDMKKHQSNLKTHLLSATPLANIKLMVKSNKVGFHWDVKLECDPLIYRILKTKLSGLTEATLQLNKITDSIDKVKSVLDIAKDNEYIGDLIGVLDVVNSVAGLFKTTGGQTLALKNLVDILFRHAVVLKQSGDNCSNVLYLALGVLIGSDIRGVKMTECWDDAGSYLEDVKRYMSVMDDPSVIGLSQHLKKMLISDQ